MDDLDTMFASADYKEWLRKQSREVIEESGKIRNMLSDVPFTSFCAEIVEFFDPALILLRIADSDAPNLAKMVPGSSHVKARMQDTIDRETNDARKLLWQTVKKKYEIREVDLLRPVHYAAYAVDLENQDHHQLTIPQCMEGFSDICEKFFPGDTDRQANAMLGLSAFLHRDGVFGRDAAKAAASKMPAHRWSQMFATPYPDFQYVQTKLVSLYTSQSPTERNHKMEAAMKTKARNRLKSVTTDMLIHVCSNARMQQKNCKVMYAEPFMQWLEASPDAETTIAAPRNGMNLFDRKVWIESVGC